MKELLIRYKSLLVFFGTLAIVTLLAYFAILPAWRQNMDLLNRIQSIDADQEVLRRQGGRLVSLQEQSRMIQERSQTFHVKVSKDEPLGWVEAIEGLAKESGLAIKIDPIDIGASKKSSAKKPSNTEDDSKENASPGSGQESGKQKTEEKPLAETFPSDQYVSVRLTLEGDYPSIRFFLEKLELMRFYIDVVSMRISFMEPEHKEDQPVRDNVFLAPAASDPGASVSAASEEKKPADKGSVQAVLDAVIYTE